MFTFSCGSHCFNISYFNFRGYKGPRKLKTANIYPHVFEANPRKFGDAKIYHFTVYNLSLDDNAGGAHGNIKPMTSKCRHNRHSKEQT